MRQHLYLILNALIVCIIILPEEILEAVPLYPLLYNSHMYRYIYLLGVHTLVFGPAMVLQVKLSLQPSVPSAQKTEEQVEEMLESDNPNVFTQDVSLHCPL